MLSYWQQLPTIVYLHLFVPLRWLAESCYTPSNLRGLTTNTLSEILSEMYPRIWRVTYFFVYWTLFCSILVWFKYYNLFYLSTSQISTCFVCQVKKIILNLIVKKCYELWGKLRLNESSTFFKKKMGSYPPLVGCLP